jgi:hypothetical protein
VLCAGAGKRLAAQTKRQPAISLQIFVTGEESKNSPPGASLNRGFRKNFFREFFGAPGHGRIVKVGGEFLAASACFLLTIRGKGGWQGDALFWTKRRFISP